jgi:hypothetical protein
MDENQTQNVTAQITPAGLPVLTASGETCPTCHISVRQSDFFCFNCGAKLHKKPLTTNAMSQMLYYAGSVVLFPLGFLWAVRYLRENNPAAKTVGLICLIISIGMFFVLAVALVNVAKTVNQQVNQQMQLIQGF